jgi:hypothetical protein
VHLVNESNESRRRWPPPWPIALAAIGLYWLALGRRHAEHVSGNPIEVLPFVLAGLSVVAAIGLLAGGPLGRVVAALIAVAGAARALFAVVLVAGMIITDSQSTTSLNAWGFLAIFLGIAAGYGLVLVRAIRGRQPHPGSRPGLAIPPQAASGPGRPEDLLLSQLDHTGFAIKIGSRYRALRSIRGRGRAPVVRGPFASRQIRIRRPW